MKATVNRRILLIDDNPAIHDDYRKILGVSSKSTDTSLMVMESALFGAPSPRESAAEAGGFPALFDLTSALQGVEAVKRVKEALEAKNPFAVAFVDMRMPPGWDGLETILRMWEVDPSVQVVICTAYSDRSWSEIRQSLGNSDQLLILKKPFDSIEVLQCACTLTEKWTLTQLAQLRMEGLEGIIKERTAEALKAMRLKNDFLSNLSHELLTPMNGIVGLADSLESTRLNADQQELVGLLKNCSFQLMNLLKDILDFNELEANRLKLQSASFKPRNVLTEVEALLAVDVRKKGLHFACQVDPKVPDVLFGDARRLQQVLSKLAENAVRFTERGRVEIGIDLIQDTESDSLLDFRVSDTGTGMAEQTQAAVLQGFSQADSSSTREHGGIGMGLTLCRLLLELLGSRIQIQSEVAKGSCFRFRLSFPKTLRPASHPTQHLRRVDI